MYRNILVPTDGSPISARAEMAALGLARRLKARLTIVHVMAPYSPQALGEIRGAGPPPLTREEYAAQAEKRGKAAIQRVAARAKRAAVKAESVLLTSKDPGEALVKAAADRKCDLIVMGSSSRAGIERIFLGSVASEVLGGTRTPVLVCH